jgi:hypothetical protein
MPITRSSSLLNWCGTQRRYSVSLIRILGCGSYCRFALYRWSPKMKKLVLLGALALSVLSLQASPMKSL